MVPVLNSKLWSVAGLWYDNRINRNKKIEHYHLRESWAVPVPFEKKIEHCHLRENWEMPSRGNWSITFRRKNWVSTSERQLSTEQYSYPLKRKLSIAIWEETEQNLLKRKLRIAFWETADPLWRENWALPSERQLISALWRENWVLQSERQLIS